MRLFACRPFHDIEVDLDDPATYAHLPDTIHDLRQRMFEHIGYACCYMDYWYKEYFPENNEQRKRVENLIQHFAMNENQFRDNLQWHQEQVFLFEDETENMI